MMVVSPEFKTFHRSSNGQVVEGKYKSRELKDNEVLMRITSSGVCGTDLHGLNSNMVLGHEGAGIIEAVGDNTTGNWKM